MAYFNRDDRGPRRSFGGGRGGFGGGRNDRGDRQMHDAVCSNCGKNCQVPFRPTGDKPVYCSECFETMGNTRSDDRGSDRRNDRPRYEERRQERPQGPDMSQISTKLDRIISLLERMSAPKQEVSQAPKVVAVSAPKVEVVAPKAKKAVKKSSPKKK